MKTTDKSQGVWRGGGDAPRELRAVRRYGVLIAAGWTLFVALGLAWSWQRSREGGGK
ncbi:MAG: hypothetical protein ABIK09_19470 [Pseudomonadota bacterium]